MKFKLSYEIDLDSGKLSAEDFESSPSEQFVPNADFLQAEGRLIVVHDGGDLCGEYSEPVVRLFDQWLRKLIWVIGGDTETLAFRNSEHCFAFVPAGSSVEFSFFEGTELEVEDYIVEPTSIGLDLLITGSLQSAGGFIKSVESVKPDASEADEDFRDLKGGFEELAQVWRDFELRNRR